MPTLKAFNGFTEHQQADAAMFVGPLFEGASNVLRMQAEFLQRIEGAASEYLERRRAGCVAAQHLVETLRDAREPTDVLKSQQEWLADATQRMMADAAAWQTVGQALMSGASRLWSPETPAALTPEAAPPARRPVRGADHAPSAEHSKAAE